MRVSIPGTSFELVSQRIGTPRLQPSNAPNNQASGRNFLPLRIQRREARIGVAAYRISSSSVHSNDGPRDGDAAPTSRLPPEPTGMRRSDVAFPCTIGQGVVESDTASLLSEVAHTGTATVSQQSLSVVAPLQSTRQAAYRRALDDWADSGT